MSRPLCEHPGCGKPGIIEVADLQEGQPVEDPKNPGKFYQTIASVKCRHFWCREHEEPSKTYLLDGSIRQKLKE